MVIVSVSVPPKNCNIRRLVNAKGGKSLKNNRVIITRNDNLFNEAPIKISKSLVNVCVHRIIKKTM